MKQVISHPFATETTYRQMFSDENIASIRRKLKPASKVSLTTQLREGKNYATGLESYSWGLQFLENSSNHTLKGDFDVDRLLELVENERRAEDVSCPMCNATPPERPIKAKYVSQPWCSRSADDFLLTATVRPYLLRQVPCKFRHQGPPRK